jgi:hypothetical protein
MYIRPAHFDLPCADRLTQSTASQAVYRLARGKYIQQDGASLVASWIKSREHVCRVFASQGRLLSPKGVHKVCTDPGQHCSQSLPTACDIQCFHKVLSHSLTPTRLGAHLQRSQLGTNARRACGTKVQDHIATAKSLSTQQPRGCCSRPVLGGSKLYELTNSNCEAPDPHSGMKTPTTAVQ